MNLSMPSGMVLLVIAVHSPNGASSGGLASSTERIAAVGWCFGCGLAWLVLGLRSVPSHCWGFLLFSGSFLGLFVVRVYALDGHQ